MKVSVGALFAHQQELEERERGNESCVGCVLRVHVGPLMHEIVGLAKKVQDDDIYVLDRRTDEDDVDVVLRDVMGRVLIDCECPSLGKKVQYVCDYVRREPVMVFPNVRLELSQEFRLAHIRFEFSNHSNAHVKNVVQFVQANMTLLEFVQNSDWMRLQLMEELITREGRKDEEFMNWLLDKIGPGGVGGPYLFMHERSMHVLLIELFQSELKSVQTRLFQYLGISLDLVLLFSKNDSLVKALIHKDNVEYMINLLLDQRVKHGYLLHQHLYDLDPELFISKLGHLVEFQHDETLVDLMNHPYGIIYIEKLIARDPERIAHVFFDKWDTQLLLFLNDEKSANILYQYWTKHHSKHANIQREIDQYIDALPKYFVDQNQHILQYYKTFLQ